MSFRTNVTKLLIIVIALSFFASSAEARHLKLYTYDVLNKGQTSITYTLDIINGNAMTIGTPILHEVELEYGITSKWTQSLYIDYDQLAGKVNEITSIKTEFNYAFSEKGENFVDFRMNIEYAMAVNNHVDAFNSRNTPDTIEFRPIFEKNFEKFSLVFGLVISKELSAPNNVPLGKWTLGFANAIMMNLTDRIGFNLEFHSFMGESQDLRFLNRLSHYLVPNIDYMVTKNMTFSVGAGFGLTPISDNFTLRISVASSF